ERPYVLEGVVVKAVPLTLATPLPTTEAVALGDRHLRSRVASAFFAQEKAECPSSISGVGLASDLWCRGASAKTGAVALGVLARAGDSTRFFDAWTARRERMGSPAETSWARRIAMRPWRIFLAQILQFQCQLRSSLELGAGDAMADPCADAHDQLDRTREEIGQILEQLAEASESIETNLLGGVMDQMQTMHERLQGADGDRSDPGAAMPERILIDHGIIELPSAGYLPVDPSSVLTVNEQVRRLLGDGVDLRFCVIRPDDAPRHLESAQHMDRISLLRGLDDPSARAPVDVLVPDGWVVDRDVEHRGVSFSGTVTLGRAKPPSTPVVNDDLRGPTDVTVDTAPGRDRRFGDLRAPPRPADDRRAFVGAGRANRLADGGGEFHFAGATATRPPPARVAPRIRRAVALKLGPAALWLTMTVARDLFSLEVNDSMSASLDLWVIYRARVRKIRVFGDASVVKSKTSGDTGAHEVVALLDGFESIPDKSADQLHEVKYRVTAIRTVAAQGPARIDLAVEPHEVTTRSHLSHEVTVSWQEDEAKGRWIFRRHAMPDDDAGPQDDTVRVGPEAPDEAVPDDAADTEDTAVGTAITSDLAVDPAVQQTDDPHHVQALYALRLIAEALDDPAFADVAARKLFPPPLPIVETLQVRAVHDWVVFHARHRHECSVQPLKPQVVEPRRYRLWHLAVGSEDELAEVVAALRDGDAGSMPGFEAVTTVEFAAGVPSLHTPADTVAQLWQNSEVGDLLGYSAIVTETDAAKAEGEAIALGRVQRLETALEAYTPRSEEMVSEILADAADGFTPVGADGAILIVTVPRREPVTSCNHIYALPPVSDQRRLTDYNKLFQGREFDHLMELATDLGSVEFSGTSIVDGAEPMAASWSNEYPECTPEYVFTSYVEIETDSTAEDRDARIAAVMGKLGAEGNVPSSNRQSSEHPSSCPELSFVVPRTIRYQLVLVWPRGDDTSGVVAYLEKGQILKALDATTPVLSFGEMHFSEVGAQVVRDEISQGNVTMEPTTLYLYPRPDAEGMPDAQTQHEHSKLVFRSFLPDHAFSIVQPSDVQDWTGRFTGDVLLVLQCEGQIPQ
nr:hypothetical protein [Deltaproteobacteria bacterium]